MILRQAILCICDLSQNFSHVNSTLLRDEVRNFDSGKYIVAMPVFVKISVWKFKGNSWLTEPPNMHFTHKSLPKLNPNRQICTLKQ